eukprot:10400922-Alexandrium_andersonii.AAC.1
MSASLVGSEMCIRDRRCSMAPPGTNLGCLCSPDDAKQEGFKWSVFPDACLLYTSDAADDM